MFLSQARIAATMIQVIRIQMKRTLLAIVFVSGTAFSRADALSDFKRMLEQDRHETSKAFEDRDIRYFESIWADDYKLTQQGLTDSRKMALAAIRTLYQITSSIKYETKLKVASLAGPSGTAINHVHMIYVMKPPAANGKSDTKPQVWDIKMQETQTWIQVKGNWKLASSKWDEYRLQIDGKPQNSKKARGG